jgi:hypothetical protein
LRTRRDLVFIVFALLLSIFLPALSNVVNPANWDSEVALSFYKLPMFWVGFIGIAVSLTLLFLYVRKLDEKIDGLDSETRKQLKEDINTLNMKLDKLDKLDKIDRLVETLERYMGFVS